MLVTVSTLECVTLANCTLVTVSTIVVLSVVLLYRYISTVVGRSPLEILDTCRIIKNDYVFSFPSVMTIIHNSLTLIIMDSFSSLIILTLTGIYTLTPGAVGIGEGIMKLNYSIIHT